MENSPYSSLKATLSAIPARALNFSCRQIIANSLDSRSVLLSTDGFPRDYRGLAELMGFHYCEIKEFEEFKDRTLKILEAWEIRPYATLDKIISYLEALDRYDIIEALTPLLEQFQEGGLEQERLSGNPIQDVEKLIIYDAYVCYADEDSHKVKEISQVLESPRVGLKLFIRERDMLAGCIELDTDIEIIKKRCRLMMILLTKNFIKSPRLDFLVRFAGSLNIESKHRILVPVILSPCEIPPILNSVSKIDFTKMQTYDWMLEKLIVSLRPSHSTDFL